MNGPNSDSCFRQDILWQSFRDGFSDLCPTLKLIHGAIESKDRGEVHEALWGEDGLEGDEEGAPPGQDQDLLVGPDGCHRLFGDEFWFQDWDDLGLDSWEHAGVDVVGADHGRLDITWVSTNVQLNPGNKIILKFSFFVSFFGLAHFPAFCHALWEILHHQIAQSADLEI